MTFQSSPIMQIVLLLVYTLMMASSVFAFTAAPIVTTNRHSLFGGQLENNSRTKLSSDVSKQASYGVLEELPDSYVRCSKCQTVYAITESDLDSGDRGGGRRLECSVCGHAWFQSKDRLMTVQEDFALEPLPERDLLRIQRNIEEGKSPKFLGEKKLYVGNISFECHEDDFYKIFGKCGDVGDVAFVRDEAGRNRGFGFVTMRTEMDALKAVEELDGMSVRGRNIAVRESNN